MRASLVWLMEHVAGSDWQMMNLHAGDGFYVNIPLSIFFTVLITLMVNAFIFMIRCFTVPSLWRQGYDAGYSDGIYTKACKLAKIKFNHDDNVIVCEVDKNEVEAEKTEALKRY